MTLPALPSHPISREYLRVGGGYGAPAEGQSPAGGLDADAAGNLATNGDLTVGDNALAVDAANKRVGVGTGNPVQRLHLYTDSSVSTRMRLANTDGFIDLMFNAGAFHVLDDAGNTLMRWNAGEITVYKDMRPATNDAQRLGVSGARWSEVHGVEAQFSGGGAFDGGSLTAGTADGNRGVIEARHGSGGSAPGCLKLHSFDGSPYYLFVENNGTVRVHNELPTSATDGERVGAQS
jgi:hypothetical protein